MAIYSDPLALREFRHDKPTLLVCWWATTFCAFMIVSRIIGRFIRTERLFPEDKVAALALLPLFLRMACVDFILKTGTNNAVLAGVVLSEEELRRKAIASGLVLVSRALYAATLWTLKAAILGFLRRITDLSWQRSYHTTSIAIRWTLVATFVAVILSDLVECRPFHHYWQVLPDPGGQCRQGYAQLITMATCNVLTDLMLVVFPVSIIVRSNMSPCRKIQLGLLFSLSLSVVCVTLFRVFRVIDRHGLQQYRSLLASIELIFATASANALVLGSFIRDRGVKKRKFRRRSTPISYDPPSVVSAAARRPTLQQRHWGSDEDLVRDVGLGINHDLLRRSPEHHLFRKAPVFGPLKPDTILTTTTTTNNNSNINADAARKTGGGGHHHPSKHSSFLDVGGLLEDSAEISSGSYRRGSHTSSSSDPLSNPAMPSVSRSPAIGGQRRGSAAILHDIGGLLSPLTRKPSSLHPRREGTELDSIPRPNPQEPELKDPGNLLG